MDEKSTKDENFRMIILSQLEHRNLIWNQFESLFNSSLYLVFYGAKCIFSSSKNEDLSRISELEVELAELYRKKEQNDQQLIETNNRLGVISQELCAVNLVKEECQKENQKLKKDLMEREEELAALKESNILLKDEHFALQASYNSIENKYREAQQERNSLIDRIKNLKEVEIRWFNEQNEREEEERRRRLKLEFEAALNASHSNEDKTYGFEIICDTDQGLDYIGDIIPGNCKAKLNYGEDVNDIMWHPNGQMFAAGGGDHKVRLYWLSVSLAGSNESVLRVDFSGETNQVLGAGNDNAVRIWDTDDHVIKHSLTGHGNKVSSAKFFLGGSQVVSGSHDRTFKMWDLKTSKCKLFSSTLLDTFQLIYFGSPKVIFVGARTYFTNSVVYDIVSSDHYKMVVSGHYDRKIRFWDPRLKEPIRIVELANKVSSLTLSFDSTVVLASSRDETMSLIDLRSYQIIHIYSADQYRTGSDHIRCALSPGLEFIASGSSDGSIFVWNLKTTKLERTIQKRGHEVSEIKSFVLKKLVHLFRQGVHSVSWNPKGNMLLSADKEKTICLWTV
ncbi:unnamed protein product [Thelazia callipaeda]|uniref:WD_REPEATS_REGION domain-containing protein n=1 Tax=Thelazia callipaeda TaxID=103827 RepID=A0A0N5CYK0_THECL|nr:unnamed protein product [Thelazia callipaeda]